MKAISAAAEKLEVGEDADVEQARGV